MTQEENDLVLRKKALDEREKELDERERSLENKPLSQAVKVKKESWYENVSLTVHQMDIIIGIAVAALIIVFILIGLEAAGIFKL